MATPTVIIDGKDPTGKRISVSFDEALWELFVAFHQGDTGLARNAIKYQMGEGIISNSYQAKCWVYRAIAKPNLLADTSLADS